MWYVVGINLESGDRSQILCGAIVVRVLPNLAVQVISFIYPGCPPPFPSRHD